MIACWHFFVRTEYLSIIHLPKSKWNLDRPRTSICELENDNAIYIFLGTLMRATVYFYLFIN